MWLSKKIKNDKETQEVLKSISQMIKANSDPTNIKDLGLVNGFCQKIFRPNLWAYLCLALTVSVVAIVALRCGYIEVKDFKGWIDASLMVSIPILVVSISFSSIAFKTSQIQADLPRNT